MTKNDHQTLTMMALASAARTIRLHCRDCGHGRNLDPMELAAGYGDALTIALLSKRATCTKCGSRRHRLSLAPPKV